MEACEVIEMDANAPEAIPEKRCYTVEEIQTILNISRGTAYKLLEKKEFRWFKIGSAYRISKKSFDEWLDQLV